MKKKEVIGCFFDWMSNLILFTRNGRPLGSVIYVVPAKESCKCNSIVPTVYVTPECEQGKELILPSITLDFNYGTTKFYYTESFKPLLSMKFDFKEKSPLLSITY